MKKVITIILVVLVTLVDLLFGHSQYKNVDEKYYTLLTSNGYACDTNEIMTFDIYSKLDDSIILYIEENDYYLKAPKFSYLLDVTSTSIKKVSNLYLIKINAYVPDILGEELTLNDCYLEVITKNNIYQFYYKSISLLNSSEFDLLSFQAISPTYSLVNNNMLLVALNLTLTKEYDKLYSLTISNTCRGDFNNVLANTELKSEENIKEVIKGYDILSKNNLNSLKLSSKKLVIPLIYNDLSLITHSYIRLNIDDTNYYIDDFSFIISDLDINKYEAFRKEGIIL